MKAYLATTGAVFSLVTIAHLWRIAEEGSRLITEPVYALLTAVAAALSIWAWTLFLRYPQA